MSKYTTEVRYICEYYAGYNKSQDYDKINEIVKASHSKVIGDYPIFDENYREVLDTKILKHYYTREICEETVGLWKLRLNNRMNEIMPFYNKLYDSELLKFNPLYDTDLHTSRDRNEDTEGVLNSRTNEERSGTVESEKEDVSTRNGQSVSSGSNNEYSTGENETHSGTNADSDNKSVKDHTDKYSDTPQGGLDGFEEISDNLYLTNARIIGETETDKSRSNQQTDAHGKSNISTSGTTRDNTTTTDNGKLNSSGKDVSESSASGARTDENKVSSVEAYMEHVFGKRGGHSYSALLKEFRETFLNIDKMIIEELGDLFFGLWE